MYTVHAAGRELTEPDTGAVLGREELSLGRVAITELHKDFSRARVLANEGIAVGATLRRAP